MSISAGAGTIIGSIIAAAGSMGATAMSNSASSSIASESAKKSFLYTKALDKYRATQLSRMAFDQQMANLERHGINRALAFGSLSDGYQGSGQFSVPTPDVKSPDFSHSASLISKAMEQKIAEAQLKRQELMDSFSAKSIEHTMDIQDERLQIQRELADAEISLKKAQAVTESELPKKIKEQISESMLKQDLLRLEKESFPSAISLRNARIRDLEEHTRLLPEIVRKYGSYLGNSHLGRISLQDIFNFFRDARDLSRSPSSNSGSVQDKRKGDFFKVGGR